MKTKYGSLPFDAQIAFFKKKLALPTRSWTDIIHGNHDHAFVVAGANKQALVESFQAAVQKAIADGTTLAAFRKDFDRIVKEAGWDYNGSRNWRSRVIYETNLRTSYQAGRFTQLQNMDYWQYHHSPASENARKQHVAWDGLILPKDDPFWQTNYPPNGWGCKCTVTGHSRAAVQRKGLKIAKSPKLEMQTVEIGSQGPNPRRVTVPKGVGPGWAYAPGRDAWMRGHAIPPKGDAPWPFTKGETGRHHLIPDFAAHDLLPDARPFPKSRLLPTGKPPAFYADAFLKEFGGSVGKDALFIDVTGEPLILSDTLFRKAKDNTWKAMKNGREQYALMMAEVLKAPDEIWVGMEWNGALGKAVVRRRYVSRLIPKDGTRPGFVVFENASDGWTGVTSFPRDFNTSVEWDAEISKVRRGVRLYRRPE